MTAVKIRPGKYYLPVYSGCHQRVNRIHSTDKRIIKDLPMSGSPVNIYYTFRTVLYEHCGYKSNNPDFYKTLF